MVAFAGGGSGGHLYPALSVAYAMQDAYPGSRFVFFASERAIDARVLEGANMRLVPQPVRPVRMQPWYWPGIVWSWRQSTRLCRSVFEELKPAVVFASGGFASVPAVGVARRMGIPVALFNPDAIPGRASRYLASKADRIFVQWPTTVERFRCSTPVQVTGCPVRAGFYTASRNAGLRSFRLDSSKKTLLVTGASQGARAVNDMILATHTELGSIPDWQILHLTGERDYERVAAAHHASGLTGRVLAYTDEMPAALAVADLVVARAGASSLAEITAAGRASILVPYPHHRDQHQTANAEQLAHAGAARIVEETGDTSADAAFVDVLLGLMKDQAQREQMGKAAARLGKPDAAEVLSRALLDLAGLCAHEQNPRSSEAAA
ncbi:MAG: UDP-N-acetylglucosamine--N-acetylmuramyl-(pentapeptide) pyrophosphoryl-undecaprenol N-acetylglucosamine transferase [Planctomycetes bacterium]|nr:UDP-N-acetylglucosamine--N-acetylmuramyl-(pentapeptide) pyrophosphoryl-undecaprenol N-acetylglucosamine transferase [Planctomycetota bacterium]